MINYNEFCLKDITLRDYQQLAKEEIFNKWNVVDNILYQMPTGTGKTRLFTSIIRDINVWGLRHDLKYRILIIAHRSELIEQSSRSLNKYHIRHGVLAGTMKDKRDLTQPIQVASIQTIIHPSNRSLIKDLQFDFIIIDEAHHAVANSYQTLWAFCPNAKKLGVTATPWRMNNSGFAKIFDKYIPSLSIKEFTKKGWLAPYKYYSIPNNSEIIKSIESIQEFDIEGDYKISALANVVDTLQIRAQLYESYKKYVPGKKGIIYSISREHSEHICTQYRSSGVAVETIDSKTPAKIRESVIKAFRDGRIDVIINVDIFSEGFDCPDIEFIQLARPTRSLVKYIQQVGRGLRKNGDKQCIILDNVGMYTRFGFPDEDRDWEAFFYGNEIEECQKKGIHNSVSSTRGFQEEKMCEGNETMVLIQDVTPQSVNVVDFTSEEIQSNEVEQKLSGFSITSKNFNSGKYLIEENDLGFYIVNVRTKKKMFLVKAATFYGGIIAINKETNKNLFTIIKALSTDTLHSASSRIIGTLVKEGLIMKFSSFDKSVINLNITI